MEREPFNRMGRSHLRGGLMAMAGGGHKERPTQSLGKLRTMTMVVFIKWFTDLLIIWPSLPTGENQDQPCGQKDHAQTTMSGVCTTFVMEGAQLARSPKEF